MKDTNVNIRLKTEMKIKLKLLRNIYKKTIKKTKIKKWQEHMTKLIKTKTEKLMQRIKNTIKVYKY